MIVRTALGDIDPMTLGATLGHEHIYAEPPPDVTDSDLRIDDIDRSLAEVQSFAEAGGGTIVEMTTVDYGRRADILAGISRATSIHIVVATGYNKGKFADRLSSKLATDDIARWMIDEVTRGIDDTGIRAGVIKASSSLDGPGADERRVFEAAAAAHHATGAPISTHTDKGTWALGQISLLTQRGVPSNRVLIGHLDLNPDPVYLREVAATGAFLGLDQFSKSKYLPDSKRIDLIVGLAAHGYLQQIVVSGDLARRSSHWAEGGPGFIHIPKTIVPELGKAGVSPAGIHSLTHDNPRRFLAFEPVDRSAV